MKKRVPDKFWFPWWPDKWIFGSVRIECTPAERGIWVDLLSLASKDNGHIRANEETPYPLQQLSGMLIIPEDELKSAIDKFVKKTKLTRMKDGTLYVTKWDKYQFSRTTRFYVEKGRGERKSSHSEQKSKEYNILNNNKVNNNKLNNIYPQKFEEFWNPYPRKIEKKDAFTAWKQLNNKQKDEVIIASKNYAIEMKRESREIKHIKHPKRFLNKDKGRWKDYLEIKKLYQVGENIHKSTKRGEAYQEARAIKWTELHKKHKPEIEKAKKEEDLDKLDELENIIKEEMAKFSQEYYKKEA